MPQRVLNCGFFNLTDDYKDALRNLEACNAAEAFANLRTRTYLPMIDNASAPREVFSLVKAAIDVAKPADGDIIIASGTPDVVTYILDLTKDVRLTILCPLGTHRGGQFQLSGLREIVRNASECADDLTTAIFMKVEEEE